MTLDDRRKYPSERTREYHAGLSSSQIERARWDQRQRGAMGSQGKVGGPCKRKLYDPKSGTKLPRVCVHSRYLLDFVLLVFPGLGT